MLNLTTLAQAIYKMYCMKKMIFIYSDFKVVNYKDGKYAGICNSDSWKGTFPPYFVTVVSM